MSEGKRYLDKVTGQLKERIGEVRESILQGQKDIEGYWENYTEMDQYGYEDFDNQQALLHQVNANQEQQAYLHRLEKMLDSPFFGRVDFRYEGEEESEKFYIGIGNFSQKAGHMPLIYDWRAPVSGLFYDFDKGPASYKAPLGLMEGEIISKWQYKIRGGRMIYEFQSDMKIDDEILKAELGGNGDVQLKNIVRTIQKEQNAIIRDNGDSGSSRIRENFYRTSSDRISAVPRPEKSEIFGYSDPVSKQCVFRLYFPYPSGIGRGKYPGNEF